MKVAIRRTVLLRLQKMTNILHRKNLLSTANAPDPKIISKYLFIKCISFYVILSLFELSAGIATTTAYKDFSFSILGMKLPEQRRSKSGTIR
jgi:hypothetical protein